MQIHDEAMQAIVTAFGNLGDLCDQREFDRIGWFGPAGRFDVRKTFEKRVPLRRITSFNGPDHRRDIIENRTSQFAEPRCYDPCSRDQARVIDQAFQRHGINTCGIALVRQVEPHAAWIARMAFRGLTQHLGGLSPGRWQPNPRR